MKLSVSNIAWDNNELEEHLGLLRDLGCDGVEIAPSCIWNEPITASDVDIDDLKKIVGKYNLIVSAFHALLYTRPDLYLFGDKAKREDTILYLKKLMKLARKLSVKVLVYGSPASRKVGGKSYAECYSIAVDVFRELGKEAALNDTTFCIEPLGPSESDFIQNADEGYKLVKDVGHPHFGLHLDAKAMIDSKEDFIGVFKKYGRIIKHFHIGDSGLAPPGYTGFDHSLIGKHLYDSGYDGFVSIEMKRGFGNTREVVKNAVKYIYTKYFMAGKT